ncbi:linker nucleoporin NIC96 KNAG_0D02480 [Huiozyma naganishii CBS 8797]|uniref:Nuclear pore protein n=1 Tax=Huiozyma naganishii (strain ATCC MYA-139 / BCRC 22969 / CBS 8797 / KCTC 17520 / NBRC 10181 / NCYC 3082 / Yp74L-3) TaxID=1071383 RepID=J7RY18_HUIN7|nr:hypothetical protein KNAG_0D02480 [Kazachstania naganishii CBS 8797]CCK69997.1 hypothetical protein KNAG_0D02480 [Kazachstania naganishii CBS 8797]
MSGSALGSNPIAKREDEQESKGASTSKLFSDLIESSGTLPTTSSELGSIQLSINEINRRTKEMRAHTHVAANRDHTKAHYLLAGSGLAFDDVDTSLQNLQRVGQNGSSLGGARERDGKASASTTEIDSYLKLKKDENILTSIELVLSNAAKDFDTFVTSNLNLDWEQRKKVVRENFGILINQNSKGELQNHTSSVDAQPPSLKKLWNANGSLKNNTTPNNIARILSDDDNLPKFNVNEHHMVRAKFEGYGEVIHRFNNARQARAKFPLHQEFIRLLNSSGDNKNIQLLQSWRILEIADKSKMKNTNAEIINNSKHTLQSQFLELVASMYEKKMDEGLPTNINKMKSFIDSTLKNLADNTWKIANLTIVNNVPVWALIFYLLRAGLNEEALEVAVSNKSSFKKVEQSFLGYFKAYIQSKDNKLPVEFSTRLHTEYNQHIKNSLNGDPFRMAVYKIIGRCDLTRKNISAVTLYMEDWLWMHFMLIKEECVDPNDPVYERYTLEDFQSIILSHGPSKFKNSYLQILILSGLFELAVEYAYSINEIDAVHLAIELANQKLLRISTDQPSVNPSTGERFKFVSINAETNATQLNYAKVIASYTRSFKFSDPRIATEYLILIGLVETPTEIELCHEALRELVLETKEFSILLGKINRDGSRIPGVIEERQPLLHLNNEKEYLRTITEQAAHRAEEDGRIYDSLLLYQLSEEYDIVITLINGLLSDVLSNSDLSENLFWNDDTSESNPILLAERLIDIYLGNVEISQLISNKNQETCLLLLQLVKIRKLFISQQWQITLQELASLELLPLKDDASIRKRAEDFNSLNPNVIKCVPNLLVMSMTSISKEIRLLRSSVYQTTVKDQQISALKTVAKNLMVYAGMIQYKMPRETYSTLIALDVAL